MDTLTAKPKYLKQANLSLIRKAIKAKGTATRAEIVKETKISSTTVRSLLSEMMANGEIESIGYDESSGGRKAERYGFRPDRYHGAVFCITDNQIHNLIVNVCGEIIETGDLLVTDEDYEPVIIAYLDELTKRMEIRSIGIGVPGIVEGGGFWRKSKTNDELYKADIGDHLSGKYGVPVVMENDLNATAIGFGRCYEKEFPCENPENTNMAYLHFSKGCVSAGFIAGGKVIRGCRNFAGEIGLVLFDQDRLVDETMAEPMEELIYVRRVVQIVSWICGVLNPQYVALAGPDLRTECIGPISDGLTAVLPKQMNAEILYSSDVWHDYHDGMAYLTAGKMFDEVQLLKE